VFLAELGDPDFAQASGCARGLAVVRGFCTDKRETRLGRWPQVLLEDAPLGRAP